MADKSPDFVSRYANNVQFSLGATDLRIVFGESRPGEQAVQHTAITMTYAQAKVMRYFLTVNLAIYEALEAPVRIPKDMVPQPPTELSEEELSKPAMKLAYDRALQVYEKLKDEF